MIKPIGANILIEVHTSGYAAYERVNKSDSLIEKATIVAIGEEVQNLKVGDVIYFKDYETDKILEGNETYVIIQEENIKALYEPSA